MFRNTSDLIAECGLAFVHVFPYSPRPGTPAARMPQLAPAIIRERAARLREAAACGARGRTGAAGRPGRGRPDRGARTRPRRVLRPGPLRCRARERNRCGWTGRYRLDPAHALCRFRRVPPDRSTGMRFWRRNVPNEPIPDADTLPPATEEAVHPEPEPAPLSAPEAERPRGWFGWRRGDAIEPVTTPEPAEPEPAASEPATREAAEPAPTAFEPAEPEPVVIPEPAPRRPPSSHRPQRPRPRPKRPSRAAGSAACAPVCRAARRGSTRASTRSSPAAGSTPPRSKNSKSC